MNPPHVAFMDSSACDISNRRVWTHAELNLPLSVSKNHICTIRVLSEA